MIVKTLSHTLFTKRSDAATHNKGRSKWATLCAIYALCIAPLAMPVAADVPALEDVLAASREHFPAIKKAEAKREAAEAKTQEALGAYDVTFENSAEARPFGYYNGRYASSKVVKPFQDFNAKLKAGYRVSRGDFPVYDDYYYTNDGGEFNLELFMSLLRNRDIDDDRLALHNAGLDVEKAEYAVFLEKVSVQNAAMKAYYQWLSAVDIHNVRKTLLTLAEKRQKALKAINKAGDVASITLTENSQYIYGRKAALNEAERMLNNAAANLSFYWRNAEGDSVAPDTPKGSAWPEADSAGEVNYGAVTDDRPDIKMIDAEISKYKNALLAAENKLLPRLDVVASVARDLGSGDKSRQDTENIVGFELSVPLQNNAAKGKIAKNKAEIAALNREKELLYNDITRHLAVIKNDLEANRSMIALTRSEVNVAKQMQTAEEKIFKNGGSDYFLLNVREENFASAKIKHLKALANLYKTLADYYAVTFNTTQLGLSER